MNLSFKNLSYHLKNLFLLQSEPSFLPLVLIILQLLIVCRRVALLGFLYY